VRENAEGSNCYTLRMEKYRLVLASDRAKGIQQEMRRHIQDTQEFTVFQSPLSIAAVRTQIIPHSPQILLVSAEVVNSEQVNELRGFIGKVRKHMKHLPSSEIVFHTLPLGDRDINTLFTAGGDIWIDERLAYELMSNVLVRRIRGEQFYNPGVKIKPKVK